MAEGLNGAAQPASLGIISLTERMEKKILLPCSMVLVVRVYECQPGWGPGALLKDPFPKKPSQHHVPRVVGVHPVSLPCPPS